jgi:outer membrane protein assembly factor BamB
MASDWPQFLGPSRNLATPDAITTNGWPREGPRQLWSRKVGAGFSGPVAAGGKVILFHRVEDEETVECLDAKTGRALWKGAYATRYRDDFGFDEGPRGTPCIASNRVFTFGAEGMLTGWSLASGEKLWSVDTKAQFGARKGFFGMACSPLVEGTMVIVNLGGRDGAGLAAFDTATGKLKWKAVDDEASYASPVAATVNGRRRVLAVTRGAFVMLEAADGRVWFQREWRPPMSASVSAATPLVAGDEVFLSASYGLGAVLWRLEESGPHQVWASDEALSNHYATSVAHTGFLYGFHGRQEQGCALRCVEWQTGKVRWSIDGLGAGTTLVAGGQLLVLTEKGELLRAPASPAEFKPVDRAQVLPFQARAHPALAGGLFLARSKDRLVCVDLGRP